ncbi:transposase [Streptomyces sp. NBC_01483]|uniref:transposase n=1 Tax=Streptomyces sp. NBC_01483 TaxID=2903883 RepID=UPI003FCC3A4B
MVDRGGVIRRRELSDAEWEFVGPLLPVSPRDRKRLDDREVLNGIVGKCRTGTAWRDVPERYVPWATVLSGQSTLLGDCACRWACVGFRPCVSSRWWIRSPASRRCVWSMRPASRWTRSMSSCGCSRSARTRPIRCGRTRMTCRSCSCSSPR